MAWINTICPDEPTGELKRFYEEASQRAVGVGLYEGENSPPTQTQRTLKPVCPPPPGSRPRAGFGAAYYLKVKSSALTCTRERPTIRPRLARAQFEYLLARNEARPFPRWVSLLEN